MANINNPSGFRYEKNLNDESAPLAVYPSAAILNPGDAVGLTAGELVLAVAGTTDVIGVVMGPAAVDADVYTYADGSIAIGTEVQVILALPGTLFRVQCSDTVTLAQIGTPVDFAGATSVQEVVSLVAGTACMIFAIAGTDNIAGNVAGIADCDILVTFILRSLQ